MSFKKNVGLFAIFCSFLPVMVQAEISYVISADEVKWGYLNPLRGDKSPAAADLWGDRTKGMATGMLVKFPKGFSSPPHIHNISYRGVVMQGLMHNADPSVEKSWMPKGSFWTQPAGDDHITAADADKNMIYLEIDDGPYLVQPSKGAFDNGEAAINLHASNMVWLSGHELAFVEPENVEVSFLWEREGLENIKGFMLKLPAGFVGEVDVDAQEFRAVIIDGFVDYLTSKRLPAGSYFGSTGEFNHKLSAPEGGLVYVRTNGLYKVRSIR